MKDCCKKWKNTRKLIIEPRWAFIDDLLKHCPECGDKLEEKISSEHIAEIKNILTPPDWMKKYPDKPKSEWCKCGHKTSFNFKDSGVTLKCQGCGKPVEQIKPKAEEIEKLNLTVGGLYNNDPRDVISQADMQMTDKINTIIDHINKEAT